MGVERGREGCENRAGTLLFSARLIPPRHVSSAGALTCHRSVPHSLLLRRASMSLFCWMDDASVPRYVTDRNAAAPVCAHAAAAAAPKYTRTSEFVG